MLNLGYNVFHRQVDIHAIYLFSWFQSCVFIQQKFILDAYYSKDSK